MVVEILCSQYFEQYSVFVIL